MNYAIVDIETTGGYAAHHGITEIAIIVFDGKEVIKQYSTLINPNQPIPIYIQSLTGITDEMVADAPDFRSVAATIYDLLKNCIFVAHNVNFDYSFVKHHLEACGFPLHLPKLCTVRLSRKIFPGFPSYSLGKLCNSLNINISNRHRAFGDAEATAILMGMLIDNDTQGLIETTLKRSSKEQTLPPNLKRSELDKLPNSPGVYYFKDQKGKIIYIGKAKQLKKRVTSHFTGHNITLQRQNFLKSIHYVDFEICGTELMAFILEAAEIKQHWPENNSAMKRFEQKYALYQFEDQNGYLRLGIDKVNKKGSDLFSFNRLLDGHQLLRTLVADHYLCAKLCFIQRPKGACTGHELGTCAGACIGHESADDYNERVHEAISQLQELLPSFVLVDSGRSEDERSCIWVEKGKFYGMGYLSDDIDIRDKDLLKSALKPYPSNDYILNLILNYSERYPQKVLSLSEFPDYSSID